MVHARDLPRPGQLPDRRPTPAEAAAAELRGVRKLALAASGALGGAAAWAPVATQDPRAAWLPGIPALLVGAAVWAARRPRRCRVALILATACVATLAVATAGVLSRLAQGGQDPTVVWQATVFLICASFLLGAWPAFRRAEAARAEAEAVVALYEELP